MIVHVAAVLTLAILLFMRFYPRLSEFLLEETNYSICDNESYDVRPLDHSRQ